MVVALPHNSFKMFSVYNYQLLRWLPSTKLLVKC